MKFDLCVKGSKKSASATLTLTKFNMYWIKLKLVIINVRQKFKLAKQHKLRRKTRDIYKLFGK